MMKMFIYTDSTTISAHIDKDLYKTARGVLDHFGYYNSMMDYYFPVIWSQIIDQALTEESRFSSDFGVDRYFLKNSEKLGIEILEIEDYMETEYAFATLSESTQELLLSSTVDPEYIKNYSSSLEELYDAWKYGKTDVLDDLLFSEDDEEVTDEEKAAGRRIQQRHDRSPKQAHGRTRIGISPRSQKRILRCRTCAYARRRRPRRVPREQRIHGFTDILCRLISSQAETSRGFLLLLVFL